MAIGNNIETLEKENCDSEIWKLRENETQDSQNDNLLNYKKEESHDSESSKLMDDETRDSEEERISKQQKARRLCRIKFVIMVAVCVIVLLIIVEIIIKYTSIANTVSECATPPNLNHSRYLKNGNTAGAVSVYQCMDGYLGIGDEEIFCQDDGQWSKSTFVCMEECPNPPDVMDSTSTVSGVKASYWCKDGFHPVGETTIECQDGNWSPIKFSCSKYCGLPPEIQFSKHQMNGNISGAITSYHCLDGYVPVGETNVVCSKHGKWSNVNLSCLKDCPKPPDVLNSTSNKSVNKSGVFVSYQCDIGFYPVGDSSIVCQNGKWSTVNFNCSKYCGKPPDIQFSKQQINGYISGSNTSYHCLDGFILVGEPNIVCNSNGEWSPVKLSCLKDCPKIPDVLNSTSNKSVNKSGVFASYQCHIGFYPVGDSSIVCQDGKWSTVNLSCLKYCEKPPDIPFSTHQINGNMSGAITSYHCRSGYVPVGEPNIVCNSYGEWSPVIFSCLKDCGDPPTIRFARPRYTSTYFGSKVNYHCNSGYISSGYSNITCKSDGKWTMSNFECKPADCGDPPAIRFARLPYTSTYFGSKVNYHCIDGYISSGYPTITCKSDGKWTMSNFECKPVDCGGPPTIHFARPLYTSTYFGSKVNYHCNDGYISRGYPFITCQSNGKWTTSNFECKPAAVKESSNFGMKNNGNKAKPRLPHHNPRPPVHTNTGNAVILSIRNLTFMAVFGTMIQLLFVNI